MKTHEPNKKFFDNLLENGFKTFSLLDMEGNKLVAFATKSNVQPQTKIKEITQRLHIAPNGIYKLLANFNYSTRTTPEIYYLNKGNVDASYLNEQPIIVQQPAQNNSKKEKPETNVLSLDSALTRIEELSKLRAENEVLKQRVKDLEIENTELLAELDEQPELSEQPQGDKFGNWLQTIMPTLSPLADEYFKLQNRKVRLEEAKIMQGSRTPQPQKRVVKTTRKDVYPDINDPQQLEGYFAELDKLSEEEFNNVCDFISKDNPPLYAIIEQTYYAEEEEEEEESAEN